MTQSLHIPRSTPDRRALLCRDMADVCGLAHKRTVRDCRKRHIRVDCNSAMLCGAQLTHLDDHVYGDHYTRTAQEIFEAHYDRVCAITGL